jgi:alkylation response protein AidB-like acyl-CoA dehydrogenase
MRAHTHRHILFAPLSTAQVADECLQLHGGYGFMWEYPITRAFADARVQKIYGGANEIMKVWEHFSPWPSVAGPPTPHSDQIL